MNFDESVYDAIDRYLQGEMSDEELSAFELKMKEDKYLFEEVKIQKATRKVLVEQALRQKLDAQKDVSGASVEDQVISGNPPGRGKNGISRYLSLVLILTLIFLTIFIFRHKKSDGFINSGDTPILIDSSKFSNDDSIPVATNENTKIAPSIKPDSNSFLKNRNQESNQKLPQGEEDEPNYIAFAKDLHTDLLKRKNLNPRNNSKSGLTDLSLLDSATLAFREIQYDKVIQLLKFTPLSDEQYYTKQLLVGHAYYKLNDPETAKEIFEKLMSSSYINIRNEAEYAYLLSLLALKEEKTSAFREKLNQILENKNHFFYSKAKELKNKIVEN